MLSASSESAVRAWLLLLVGLIALMVALGGITRLTGSGLSMVEWHPLMGALPPLDEAAWQQVFEQYQQSPQYQQVNHWMALEDFQQIFLWEYLHRLCGRVLGVVFLLPWLFFLLRGWIRGALVWKTALAFVLGGLQGLLGWYMVRSGLVDRPHVSHLRLAAHLGLAFVTVLYILWLWLGLRWPSPGPRDQRVVRILCALGGLVSLQVVYGAFMAGLRAGLLSNTFPGMLGSWLPFELLRGMAVEDAAVWSPLGVHILHRALGWTVLFLTLGVGVWARHWSRSLLQYRLSTALLGVVSIQFTLGAITVLLSVPTWAAVAHQLGALLLLGVVVAAVHAFRGPGEARSLGRAPSPVIRAGRDGGTL
jgi:cytochrome c oxidase assembly protein subunit 15